MTEYPQNMLRCGPVPGTSLPLVSGFVLDHVSLDAAAPYTAAGQLGLQEPPPAPSPHSVDVVVVPGSPERESSGTKRPRISGSGIQRPRQIPPQRKMQKTQRGSDVAARLQGARRAPLLTTDGQMSAAWWRISTALTPHQEVELQRLFSKPLPWNIVEDVRSSTSGARGALRAEGGRQPLQCRPFLSPFRPKQRTWVSPWNPPMQKRPHRLDQRRCVMTFFSLPPKRPR